MTWGTDQNKWEGIRNADAKQQEKPVTQHQQTDESEYLRNIQLSCGEMDVSDWVFHNH